MSKTVGFEHEINLAALNSIQNFLRTSMSKLIKKLKTICVCFIWCICVRQALFMSVDMNYFKTCSCMM